MGICQIISLWNILVYHYYFAVTYDINKNCRSYGSFKDLFFIFFFLNLQSYHLKIDTPGHIKKIIVLALLSRRNDRHRPRKNTDNLLIKTAIVTQYSYVSDLCMLWYLAVLINYKMSV